MPIKQLFSEPWTSHPRAPSFDLLTAIKHRSGRTRTIPTSKEQGFRSHGPRSCFVFNAGRSVLIRLPQHGIWAATGGRMLPSSLEVVASLTRVERMVLVGPV